MTNDFDQRIKSGFDTLISTSPDFGPTPTRPAVGPQQRGSGRRLVAAAASILIAVAAVAYVSSADQSSPASVVVGPALLQPAPDSNIAIGNREFVNEPRLEAGGAVIAPDGTVFGLVPITTQSIDTVPPTYEERTISGLQAWAAEDGSAPTQIRRGIEIGCGTLSVTTGQGPMWPDTLETLAGAIDPVDNGVTLQLPEGWRSLGSATSSARYTNTFDVTIEGDNVRFWVRQAIGQPAGTWLSSTETNPIEISDRRQPTWHVPSGTTPSFNTLVTVRNDTLIEITGEATIDVLLDVVDDLEPVPANEWLDLGPDEANDNPTMTIEGIENNACEQRNLTIVE